ncbi:hypothetical protein ILYODFUR_037912 [Ilyodon furcidens]|uniref:Uncharacterized protein n=1 Tax=Ilyodon furcidens TaxID=33524 RepID=A0ABV0UMB3_9TELE
MLLNLLLIVLIGSLCVPQQVAEGACDGLHIILTDKKASQSSNYTSNGIPYSADRAFDGNRSTCSHTLQETTSWWSIDLQGVYNISCISIYNFNLSNHETNLSGAKIYIGNSRQNNGTNNTLYEPLVSLN